MFAKLSRGSKKIVGLALVPLLGALLMAPAAGQAAQESPGAVIGYADVSKDGVLSPRLELLADMGGRAQGADLMSALSLPETGDGSLMADGAGRVLTYVHVRDVGAGTVEALRGAGAEVVHIAGEHLVITARVAPGDLPAVAALPAVRSVQEALAPEVRGLHDTPIGGRQVGTATGACSPLISEGVDHLRVREVWDAWGLDGSGVVVAAISDTYDRLATAPTRAAQDVAAGELPGPGNPCGRLTPVQVISDSTTLNRFRDEGRALAQVIHDVAPGAEIMFDTALNGIYEYADSIRALRARGADILVDDLVYALEPIFQPGPVAGAISDVVDDGALYFNSVGNNNYILDGKNVASYETPAYRPMPCPGLPGDCHDFNPTGEIDNNSQVVLAPGGLLDVRLHWAEPWDGVVTDLDMVLTDRTGAVLAKSVYNSLSTQRPFETLSYQNKTGAEQAVFLFINRFKGKETPRFKYQFHQTTDGLVRVEYSQGMGDDIVGPTVWGQATSPDAITLGAVRYLTKAGPEQFSSRGPAVHYFERVSGDTPAKPIEPEVIAKPDLTATNGIANSFFGEPDETNPNIMRFYGSSAAAPHAAAAAALLLEAARGEEIELTQEEVRFLMQETALAMPRFGPEARGAGLLDAYELVATILPEPEPEPEPTPEPKPGAVQFAPAAYAAREGESVEVTVARTGGSDGAVEVQLVITQGTATAEDVRGVPCVVRFAAGDAAPKVCRVELLADGRVEGEETLAIRLRAPSGGATVAEPSVASVTIRDADRQQQATQVQIFVPLVQGR